MNQIVRTRYAPSPTGKVHLGGLRTALYSYLWAKKNKGQFILRIEDTDKSREVPGAAEKIEHDLVWAGLKFDESPIQGGPHGPYIQSQRLDIYKHHIETLLKKGHAYRCFCDEHRLSTLKQGYSRKGIPLLYDRSCLTLSQQEIQDKLANKVPYTIRMKIPDGHTLTNDILRGTFKFDNVRLDDQILIKSDGFPTYHFACVVDDHEMKISHVIRGDEWVPSFPKHVILYNFFGWDTPNFVHLPLLLNLDKTKLSKRQGDISVIHYKDKGILPAALINFVAMLGWSPNSTKEVFEEKDLIEEFSLDRVHKSPAVVNFDKLLWFNEQHLRALAGGDSISILLEEAKQFINEKFGNKWSDEYVTNVIKVMKERLHSMKDVQEFCTYYFVEPEIGPSHKLHAKLWKPTSKHRIELLKEELENIPEAEFNANSIANAMQQLAAKHKISMGEFYNASRYLLTGMPIGAPIPNTMEVLGKDVVLQRLATYKSWS